MLSVGSVVQVTNADGMKLGPGQLGEICVQTLGFMKCYLKNETVTRQLISQ